MFVCERKVWQDPLVPNSAVWISEVSQIYTQRERERQLSQETGSEQHAGCWPRILVLFERAEGERERQRGLGAGFGERNSFLTHTRFG